MMSREEYEESIYKTGTITSIIAIIVLIAVPVLAMIISGYYPGLDKVFSVVFPIAIPWFILGAAEFIAYAPVLGPSGTYLSFITGNVSNLKLPASLAAKETLGAKPGSEEGEIASTLAIATSSIITTIILVVGLIAIEFIAPYLENPILKPGFDNIMPALIGAMLAPYIVSRPSTLIAPAIFVAFMQLIVIPLSGNLGIMIGGFMVVLTGSVTIITEYIRYTIKKK